MNMLSVNTSAPTIASSAMLVDLHIGFWAGRKKDKAASDEVARLNNAEKGVTSVIKQLLGDCAELDAVHKFAANARNVHTSATMPWFDRGPRLLPTSQYFMYHQQITALRDEFARLAEVFLQAYAWKITQAQAKLGHLFVVSEYPNEDKLRKKFRFNMTYIPLPETGDWRVDMEREAQDALREQYQAAFTAQLKGAMDDIWQRLHTTLSTLSRQLSDQTEDGKTPKIYASVFDRANEIIDMMETCNITNDMNMQLMQKRLKLAFRGVTVENVKDDANLRRETKRTIDEAIKALPSLDM
jgi:exonuclease VII large subunit